jgi:SAM-dependent methyltransferase
MLCARGRNRGVGVDPVHAGLDEALPGGGRLRIVGEPFGPRWDPASADLVVARHVLEHVEDPVTLLEGIRRALRPTGLAYVEVPDGMWTLFGGAIFDLVYEHCSYFVLDALEAALRAARLEPLWIEKRYGGQFLGAEARPGGPAARPPVAAAPQREGMARVCSRFGGLHRAQLATWRGRLESLRAAGKRAVLWGAGSKGVTFLNSLSGLADVVHAAVDQNPRKQGRFVPGTGHRILPPDALPSDRPDAVVLLNPLYRDEVASALGRLRISAEILTPPG